MQPKLLFEGRKRGPRSFSLIVDEQMRTSLKPVRLSGQAAYELAAVVSFGQMKLLVLSLGRKIRLFAFADDLSVLSQSFQNEITCQLFQKGLSLDCRCDIN